MRRGKHGNVKVLPFTPSLFTLAEQPGLLDAAFDLESLDGVDMLQCQRDVVQAAEQALPAEGINFESEHLAAVRIRDRLRAEIDHQPESGKRGDILKQAIDLEFGQYDWQQAVLEAVVVENIGITRRDQRTEAKVVQRPGCVLARGAAAEILARKQNLRALVARLVQDEIGIWLPSGRLHSWLAMIQITPGVEKIDAEPRAPDGFQELLRDDGVGVDVGAIQRRNQAFHLGEFLHRYFFSSASFSMFPPTAT